MRGDYIDKRLRKCKIYRGTFAADELYKLERCRRPCLAVLNAPARKYPGEHWTVIYLDDRENGEYFDSYGLVPSKAVMRFLNKNCIQWKYNAMRIQSTISTFCGLYCIAYCVFKCKGKNMKEFLNTFTTDTMLNDYIVKRFLRLH